MNLTPDRIHADTLFQGDTSVPRSIEDIKTDCRIIKHGLQDAGERLRYIQSHNEYRTLGYHSFEEFCVEEFGWSRVHGYRMIQHIIVNQNLEEAGLPHITERAAREISDLPAEQQVEITKAAKAEADTRPLPARCEKFQRGRVTGPLLIKHRVTIIPAKETEEEEAAAGGWNPRTPHPDTRPLTEEQKLVNIRFEESDGHKWQKSVPKEKYSDDREEREKVRLDCIHAAKDGLWLQMSRGEERLEVFAHRMELLQALAEKV